MKKTVLLSIFLSSFSFISFSQDLWRSFPSSSHCYTKVFVNPNGTVMLSSKETSGFYGEDINIEQNKLTIGSGYWATIITFDGSDPKAYNNGSAVYYLGKDKYDIEYKIYFNLKTFGGKKKAIQIVNSDGSGTTAYYIN